MTITQRLLSELKRRDITIEPRPAGRMLVSHPGEKLPPDFERQLRAHKHELLAWLNAQHTAKQIALGEHDGANAATVAALIRTLQIVRHPYARRAIEKFLLADAR